MFYNANGTLEKKNKNKEHFTINDIGYRDTKFIDENSDPLYNQYYQKEREEKSLDRLNNIYKKDKNIGINNENPIGTLTVGDSSKNSDGNIIVGKKQGMQSQNYKIGVDEDFWLTIGNNGTLNKNTQWKKSVRINKDAPDNSIAISNRGLVGLGTSNPYAKLTVDSYNDSQIQRLRNRMGYYDVDIQQNSFNEENVKFSTNTKKFYFDNPVSTKQIRLESDDTNAKPEIRMFANNGKDQLNSVNLKAKKEIINKEAATHLYIGRNIKKTGEDVDHIVYDAQGYIGIGNLKPQAPLHIESTTNKDGDNGFRIKAGGPNNSHIKYGPKNDWYVRSGHSDGKVIIQDTGGNVGIGISDPLTKLHVSGDTALQGQTFANNITLKNDGSDWYHRSNGDAAIVNSNNYNTLMIVGRESNGSRNIGMWDNVNVAGNLNVGGEACFNGVCIGGNDLIEMKNAITDLYSKLDQAQQYFVKHGDQVTIKSIAHGGKRLQNANGPAKFDNHNRDAWEKMIVEKCGLPGSGDNKNCT